MPRSTRRTRPASRADARAYFAKAGRIPSLELGNRTAATGNAVHAGIAAGDAIAAALVGAISQGEHTDAPAHLDSIGGDGLLRRDSCGNFSP